MKTKTTTKSFFMAVGLAAAVSFGVLSAGAQSLEGDPIELAAPGTSLDSRIAELLGAYDRLGVDWASLAAKNGYGAARSRLDFVALHGGIEALVLEDNFSGGVAVDMSAYAGADTLADSFVYNGTVAPEHDLGNVYVYANFDPVGNLVLYAGVERLGRIADSFIELELNQDRVGVTGGVPWPIRGERTDGDLLIRAEIVQGVVSSVEVRRWFEGSFEPLAFYDGLLTASCNGEPGVALFCATEAQVALPQELWDLGGNPVAPIPAERMFEVGINAGRLLGTFVEYSAIQVRTPEDIVLGTFKTTGYWARRLDRAK